MENKYLNKKTKPVEIKKQSVSDLVENMSSSGFQGRKLGEAAKSWQEMIKEKEITIWLGISGAIIPAGLRKVIAFLVKNRFVDAIVSTGAQIFHETFETLGKEHFVGESVMDDCRLFKDGVVRFHDILAKEPDLLAAEFFIKHLAAQYLNDGQIYSSREITNLMGRELLKISKDRDSILINAYKQGVPVFVPSFGDSYIGIAVWYSAMREKKNFIVDTIKDLSESAYLTLNSKKTGVVYLGGGVPKNYIQQTAEITPNLADPDYVLSDKPIPEKDGYRKPHSYAIQITTDAPHWGGLCFSKFSRIIVAGQRIKFAKNVKIGDKLLTVDSKHNLTTTEVKKILKRKINNKEKIYVIKVEDKRIKCGGDGVTKGKNSGHKVKLVVTEDHLILTQRGWLKAKDLTLNDRVLKITQYDKTSFDNQNKIPYHLHDYLFSSGKENPMTGKTGNENPFFGKKHSKEVKEYLSILRAGKGWEKIYGKEIAEDLKKRYQKMMRGEKNPSWAGGTSWEPYNEEFWQIRKEVLKRDFFTCKVCGLSEQDCFKKYKQPLHIHHIDYDKKNSNINNLVALCVSCHGKTIFPKNRELWKEKILTQREVDCPEFLSINEIIVYEKRKQIVGCLHGDEVYDFICEPYHNFFSDWILIHNSGCTFEEAQSWGKVCEGAKKVQCFADVTLALPFIAQSLLEKSLADAKKRKKPRFDWGQSPVKVKYK
ncbi:MAG: hypothetical protein A2174_01035 [Candidatus Portnoybacteria bacterium RBG_13_41_18]|uniref:Uncharacterized protein n=1 Tax=Candidatus Portnoybacteria bacterium RBG_13_41_18 TaxID=1801991 RepID=A0A1G2F6U4_9BACT|nr:MAG: hypothetical protein A2174_01035 [Candidatus Portnoybacteria bacterium RBG_13_41_18]